MSLRVLLSVVLAAALLAASLPAIESARRARADQQLTESVERFESATRRLVRHSDPVRPGVPGAVRRVQIEMPRRPSGATFSLGPDPAAGNGSGTILRASVPGEPDVVVRLAARVRPVGSSGPVREGGTLALAGSTTLTLEYRLVAGDPVVTVARGFKYQREPRRSHVRTVGFRHRRRLSL
ncbi:MAG: hypothetical protein ABEJ60_05405 [Halodesulfurarchaeum sp.]